MERVLEVLRQNKEQVKVMALRAEPCGFFKIISTVSNGNFLYLGSQVRADNSMVGKEN